MREDTYKCLCIRPGWKQISESLSGEFIELHIIVLSFTSHLREVTLWMKITHTVLCVCVCVCVPIMYVMTKNSRPCSSLEERECYKEQPSHVRWRETGRQKVFFSHSVFQIVNLCILCNERDCVYNFIDSSVCGCLTTLNDPDASSAWHRLEDECFSMHDLYQVI